MRKRLIFAKTTEKNSLQNIKSLQNILPTENANIFVEIFRMRNLRKELKIFMKNLTYVYANIFLLEERMKNSFSGGFVWKLFFV